GLRLGRQLIKTVAAQPGGELSPVGIIGACGVLGSRGARVILGGFAQTDEAWVDEKGREGRGVLFRQNIVGRVDVRLCSVFVRTFPTPRGGREGVVLRVFVRHLGRSESRPISPPYRTCLSADKSG